MYLANKTRAYIAFSVNLLAIYSSSPTKRHCNGVRHVLRYIRRTIDMGFFYSNKSNFYLVALQEIELFLTQPKTSGIKGSPDVVSGIS